MKIRKALITAAAPSQRQLPLQTLIDRDGTEKSVLEIIVEQAVRARVETVCVVISPGSEEAYAKASSRFRGAMHFVEQPQPLGYGHAVWCARGFIGREPFLHLVGDHVYICASEDGCARRLVDVAEAEECSVSAVQATRENLLTRFGAVAGPRVPGRENLCRIEHVIEKPTPTEAEQKLFVPGLRAGQYLCFFGMHVLTPTVMDILERQLNANGRGTLSAALAELASREQYLALEQSDRRYDVGSRYGLLNAQLALALSGRDRDQVLANLVELLATQETAAAAR